MGILIQGGRIVDAATDTDKKGDIYLEDGIIAEIGQKLKKKDGDRVIDAKGKLELSIFMSIFVIRARHIRKISRVVLLRQHVVV